MSTLSSGKKRDVNHIRIAPSAALLSLSVVLCSSIFAQLYLLPYNPLSGIVQDNKAYAEKEFKMKISVDQDPIQTGDTQKITVTVRDANTNDKISDAFVKLAIDPPSGKVATGSSHTDDNGQTTFNIRISSDADTGTFNVAARASANGYASKTVTAPFEVISSDNNNNNDNNNQDSGAHNNNDHNGHNHNGANNNKNNNNNDQVQVISQSNVCGNGKLANDVKCQNIGNQIQSGGHNKDGSKHGQSQSIAQANVCGNGKGASDVNCQNLANQVQGDGNAVNVIGVQSGGGGGNDDSHNDGSDNGGNAGQTGQLGVRQSGTSGNGDGSGGSGSNNNNGHGHHGQSQSIAQANVCGNGKGASDVNCQNLANQVQGDGNAVNIIGVQPGDDNKDNAEQPSSNDQNDTGFVKTGHDSSNNNNDNNAAGSDSGVNDNAFSDACNQAVNRHIAAGGLHGEMAKQMQGQLCG
ncbi:MAG: hypothetical protein ACTHKP_00680 [Nitrososphaeraceae archaeon]